MCSSDLTAMRTALATRGECADFTRERVDGIVKELRFGSIRHCTVRKNRDHAFFYRRYMTGIYLSEFRAESAGVSCV